MHHEELTMLCCASTTFQTVIEKLVPLSGTKTKRRHDGPATHAACMIWNRLTTYAFPWACYLSTCVGLSKV